VSAPEPRIAPLAPQEWGEDAVAALRGAFGDAAAERMLAAGPDVPHVPNVLTTMMRHPKLAGPFLIYNAVLLNAPSIDPRLRELMILRVASRTRAPYEWIQHVRMGRSLGLSDDELDALANDDASFAWSPLEADLLAATDQLLDHYRIDDDTWARLAEHLDERQLFEITFVVGTYTGLAMAFNTFGIELDPELHDIAPQLPD